MSGVPAAKKTSSRELHRYYKLVSVLVNIPAVVCVSHDSQSRAAMELQER